MIAFRAFTKRFGRHTAVHDLTFDVAARRGRRAARSEWIRQDHQHQGGGGPAAADGGDVLVGDPPRPARRAGAPAAPARSCRRRCRFPTQLTGREVVEFYGALRGLTATARRRGAGSGGAERRDRRGRVGTYSGGMVQRLGLAVALAARRAAPAARRADGRARSGRPLRVLRPHRASARHRSDRALQLASDGRRRAARRSVRHPRRGRLVATFSARELAARLADRGVMKVAVDRAAGGSARGLCGSWRRRPSSPRDQLDRAGAGSRAAGRARRASCAAGVEIRGLTAEEGRLDTLYRELVGGRGPDVMRAWVVVPSIAAWRGCGGELVPRRRSTSRTSRAGSAGWSDRPGGSRRRSSRRGEDAAVLRRHRLPPRLPNGRDRRSGGLRRRSSDRSPGCRPIRPSS